MCFRNTQATASPRMQASTGMFVVGPEGDDDVVGLGDVGGGAIVGGKRFHVKYTIKPFKKGPKAAAGEMNRTLSIKPAGSTRALSSKRLLELHLGLIATAGTGISRSFFTLRKTNATKPPRAQQRTPSRQPQRTTQNAKRTKRPAPRKK